MTSERPDGSISSFDFGSSGAVSESTVTPAAPAIQAAAAAPHTTAFRPPKAIGGLAFGTRPLIPLSGGQSAFQPKPVTVAHAFGGLSTVDSSYKPSAPAPASNPSSGSSGNVESVRVRDQGILVLRVRSRLLYASDEARKSFSYVSEKKIGSGGRQQLPLQCCGIHTRSIYEVKHCRITTDRGQSH